MLWRVPLRVPQPPQAVSAGPRASAWMLRLDGVRLALAGVIAVAVAIRVAMAASPSMPLDGDEAITGIMATRILGGDLPLFFGVQNYQGAIEQYLQAPLIGLFGTEAVVLRTIPVMLAAVACLLTYAVGSRVCGSRWGGVLAASLYAVGPPYLITKGVLSHGGYGGATVAGLLAMLLALQVRRGAGHQRALAAGCGLAAGVALWENPIGMYLVVPALAWILGSARSGLRGVAPWTAGGLLLGLAPIAAHQIIHGPSYPYRSNQQPDTGFIDRLDGLVDSVLPRFLGVPPEGNLRLVAIILTVAALSALVLAVCVRRAGLRDMIMLRTTRRQPIDMVLAGMVLCPIVYALSPFAWLRTEPRYLFTLYPLAAIAVAAAVVAVPPGRVRSTLAPILAGAIVLGFGATAVAQMNGAPRAIVTNLGEVAPADIDAAVRGLDAAGVRTAYANYWLAGPIQFASEDRISVATGAWTQLPAVEQAVRRSAAPAIIVPTGAGTASITSRLRANGHRFDVLRFGTITVVTSIAPLWHPQPTDPVFGAL